MSLRWLASGISTSYPGSLLYAPGEESLGTRLAVSINTNTEMYNKTIIEFGFCDMQNYQGLGKLDLDNSAYHKNLIQ
jgi:hypothetical protein